ncbi:MAG TPA: biosynthetic-type acetolactate synthase large subunit [Bacillota bacterium]|nr:biosynthetic-type acetolactate synthase large subunit [Bacillota bacterium]
MRVEGERKLVAKENMTGADLLIQTLVDANVDTIFGYPGGAVLPIYDALYRSDAPFKHILSRHEQGSIHAAEGYARVTGKPGVVIGTSGPGATNLITGIADAMMDSLPVVVFTGQVASSVIGTDAFQETDVMGLTTPITKYNYQVKDLADLPRIVNEAFHIATTGRPGPVVVDIPKDISETLTAGEYPTDFHLPGYQPTTKPNPLQIKKLTEAIKQAEKPLILAGAGVVFAEAAEQLKQFAESYNIPVVNTLLGLGSFPASHPLSLGMAGMHGSYTANMAIYDCDLLINIGARFDDRLTGNLKHFAPKATVAHIDIDPAEIGKNVMTEIPVVADAKEALDALLAKDIGSPSFADWENKLMENKVNYPFWYNDSTDELLSPQWLIEQIYKESDGEAIVTTDVGQHQMWAAQFYKFEKPNRWVTSGGLGTMGFGFPAAVGAQLGKPDDLVVAIVGDGGFQMTLHELSVVHEHNLPVKIMIVNNEALGMVRQWQEKFYDKRYSESILANPDFVKLAESYGVKGYRVNKAEEFVPLLKEVFAYDGPVVVDCRVIKEECVYPMVAPGKGLQQMIGVKK